MQLNTTKAWRWMPWAVLGMGLGALVCRWGLYTLGLDEKGLLEPWHICRIGLWALTLGAAGLSLLAPSRRRRRRTRLREALGELLCALGIGLCVPGIFRSAAVTLDLIHACLGVLAAAGLLWGALCRWRERDGGIPAFAPTCLFLAVGLVCRYRSWSSHPQVLDYFYQLMGALGMMLFAYLRCLPRQHKQRRMAGLLGAFCCLAALSAGELSPMYLGGAAWLLSELDAWGEELA